MARGGFPSFGKYHHTTGNVRKHSVIAEKALGHKLPEGAVVHHIDGNRANNANTNLLICPNEAYHNLIHIRTRAMEESGNPNLRKCAYCRQYDDPATMTKRGKHRPNPQYQHKACHTADQKRRRNGHV